MKTAEENYLKRELYHLVREDPAIFDFLQAGSLDGMWYWDLESPDQEWMNPAFWELLGYDPSEKSHLSSEWQDLIHPDDLKKAMKNFETHCKDPSHPYDQVVRYRHRDGSTVWVRCRGVAIRDESGKPVRMLGAHNDLTQVKKMEARLKAQNEKLKKLAFYDSLTGIYNRHIFQEHFESLLNIAVRQNSPLSLLIIDIDHFKQVNDTFGHLEGDKILKSVAGIIRTEARDSDIIARFGGEEFVALLPGTDIKGSLQTAERFRWAIEKHPWKDCRVTVSVGISSFLKDQNPGPMVHRLTNKLIKKADGALYSAKAGGRNMVCHFNRNGCGLPADAPATATEKSRTDDFNGNESMAWLPLPEKKTRKKT